MCARLQIFRIVLPLRVIVYPGQSEETEKPTEDYVHELEGSQTFRRTYFTYLDLTTPG
jgi:hypothetical protein